MSLHRSGSNSLATAAPASDDIGHDFNSRDYRCCCQMIHAKIGTFIFITWVFHEIVLGAIYLFSRVESGQREFTPLLGFLLVCRLVQLASVATLYFGLWRHKRFLLLPFAIIQPTVGSFADISTLFILREDFGDHMLLFGDDLKWLNIMLILGIYLLILSFLLIVLYKCYVFIKARNAHDESRRIEKQQQSPLSLSSSTKTFGKVTASNMSVPSNGNSHGSLRNLANGSNKLNMAPSLAPKEAEEQSLL